MQTKTETKVETVRCIDCNTVADHEIEKITNNNELISRKVTCKNCNTTTEYIAEDWR